MLLGGVNLGSLVLNLLKFFMFINTSKNLSRSRQGLYLVLEFHLMINFMFGEMVLTVNLVFKSKILQRQNSPSEFQTLNLIKKVLYPSFQEMPIVLP